MIKQFLLCLLAACCLPACVSLSPAGSQVNVLKEPQQVAEACRALGQVRVSSEDALRNATVDLAGDTAVMSFRHVNGATYIQGSIYDCGLGPQAAVLAPTVVPPAANTGDATGPDKSEKCRLKGGRWHKGWCVIDID